MHAFRADRAPREQPRMGAVAPAQAHPARAVAHPCLTTTLRMSLTAKLSILAVESFLTLTNTCISSPAMYALLSIQASTETVPLRQDATPPPAARAPALWPPW